MYISQLTTYRSLRNPSLLYLPKKLPNWVSGPKRCAMLWNLWKNNFPIFIFWEMVDFVFKSIKNVYRFLRAWFRNLVTSWLWGLNLKSSGTWGRSRVGSGRCKAPHEPGVSGGGAPITQEIFETFISQFIFLLRNLMELFLTIFFPFS